MIPNGRRGSPSQRHLDKKYHVQVDCVADAGLLARITRGRAVDGEQLRAKGARLLRHGDKNSWLEITLTKARTGRFGVCSKRWGLACCVWCACRSGRSNCAI